MDLFIRLYAQLHFTTRAKRKTDKVKHYDSFDELPKGAKQVYESLRDLGPKYKDENLWIYIFNEELAEFS